MKKFLKSALFIALSACLCLGLVGCFDASERKVTYALNGDGESYRVSKIGSRLKNVSIPATYKGLPVTRIASGACTRLVWMSSVDYYGIGLNKLVLPKSIKYIDSGAFCLDSVDNLYYEGTLVDWLNIDFGCSPVDGSLYIGGKIVENLRIPDGVTVIPDYAFNCCYSIKSIEIPEGVEEIGAYAFSSTGAKQVSLPQSLTSVGSHAFYYNNINSLEIPSAINSWGEEAFSWCNIVNLTLPEGLTCVGESAFDGNVLTELTIPSTLTNWGACAFENCHIEKLYLTDGLQSVGSGAFRVYSGGHDEIIGELTLPPSIIKIENYAFSGKKIAKLNIPCGVEVGKGAFDGCGLTDDDINEYDRGD